MFRKLHNLRLFLKQNSTLTNVKYKFCAVDNASIPLVVDYNQIMIKIGKAKEFDDRHNILLMKNTQQIFDLVYKPKNQLTLNDYIKVLEQLTKICQGQTYKKIYGIEKVISKIEENLQFNQNLNQTVDDETNPYIGCLMKSLNTIEYYKNMELWMKICDQICQERMDFTSREIRESLLGLFIIRRLSSKKWQQEIVLKSIKILLNYFEVHLSKNQFNLEDIVTLGYALYQHYGSEYLKNKTYLLQTIEMNASTQIKLLQDELYYSENVNKQNSNFQSKEGKPSKDNQSFTSTENEQDINNNQNPNDKLNQNEYDINKEEIIDYETDIKTHLIQIGFLFSLCDYKSSYIFNQIAFYFAPTVMNQQKILDFFKKNRYLLSKFMFYLVDNYQKKNIPNLNVFLSIIESNILSYNAQLNQTEFNMKHNKDKLNEFENQANSDYKIVYKRDLLYDDIKQEKFIYQKFHNQKMFSLQDLCIIMENAANLNLENIDQWIKEIDISFSHLDGQQCQLMDLVRFWKARLQLQQLDIKETPLFLLEVLKEKSVDSIFTQEDVIEFILFCEQEKVTHIFVDLYNYFPYYVANNIFFYDWENMCLLYYHFVKDKILFREYHSVEVNGRLNVLKEYIKMEYFSYNNRKNSKMSSESHFYKVLSVVDINEFYFQESKY